MYLVLVYIGRSPISRLPGFKSCFPKSQRTDWTINSHSSLDMLLCKLPGQSGLIRNDSNGDFPTERRSEGYDTNSGPQVTHTDSIHETLGKE